VLDCPSGLRFSAWKTIGCSEEIGDKSRRSEGLHSLGDSLEAGTVHGHCLRFREECTTDDARMTSHDRGPTRMHYAYRHSFDFVVGSVNEEYVCLNVQVNITSLPTVQICRRDPYIPACA